MDQYMLLEHTVRVAKANAYRGLAKQPVPEHFWFG